MSDFKIQRENANQISKIILPKQKQCNSIASQIGSNVTGTPVCLGVSKPIEVDLKDGRSLFVTPGKDNTYSDFQAKFGVSLQDFKKQHKELITQEK